MSLSTDFYNSVTEEQKKKKKPSQIASDQNSGLTASQNFLQSVKSGAYKEPVVSKSAVSKPTATPVPKKTNFLQSAIDTIKKTAESALKSLTGQQEPVKSPIPEKDIVKPSEQDLTTRFIQANNPSKFQGGLFNPFAMVNLIDTFYKNIDIGIEYAQRELAKPERQDITKPLAEVQSKIIEPIFRNKAVDPIYRGFSMSFLGGSEQVSKALEKPFNTPVTFGEKAYNTVGEIAGAIASFFVGGEILKGMQLGKAMLPTLFVTIGQTSAAPNTTVEQRLAKMPVDAVAGWLFSKVPATRKLISRDTLKTTGLVAGILTPASFLNALIEGQSPQEAAETAVKMGIIAGLLHIGFTTTGVITNRAISSKYRQAELVLTPEQAKTQANATNLKDTEIGKWLTEMADKAQSQGKDLRIVGEAAKKSKLAQFINAKTPEGISFGIEFVEPKKVVLLKEEGKTAKTPKAEEKFIEKAQPQIIQAEIKPLGEELTVYRGTTIPGQAIETAKPNGITGGESTSTNKAVAEQFAQKNGGEVQTYTISPEATVINHSVLEEAVKDVPQEQKAEVVKQIIQDNKIDVIKFDVTKGAKGEDEYRIINPNILQPVAKEQPKVEKQPSKKETPIEAKLEIPKGLQPLAEEARKYKSAEEFIEALQKGEGNFSTTLTTDSIVSPYVDKEKKMVGKEINLEKLGYENFTDFYNQVTKGVKASIEVNLPAKTVKEQKVKLKPKSDTETQKIVKGTPYATTDPQKALQGTPADFSEMWDNTTVQFDEVLNPLQQQLDNLKEELSNIKGRNPEKRAELKANIDELTDKIDNLKNIQQEQALNFSAKIAFEAMQIAKAAGVKLGKIGDGTLEGDYSEQAQEFRDEFLIRITERPYIETNWNDPLTKILNEMIKEYGGVPISVKETKKAVSNKKPAFNSKLAKEIQGEFSKKLKTNFESAKSQEELVKNAKVVVDEEIAKYEEDQRALAGVRTAINKEMMGFAGKSGNYKADYAMIQTLKQDPDIGAYIDYLESKVVEIDQKLKTQEFSGSATDAFKGVFPQLPVLTDNKIYFKTIPFPEMVRLAKELSGKTPIVKRKIRGGALGNAQVKTMRINLAAEIFKNPSDAAKVLAHELGHIADYLPEQTRARGNLVGRIASLQKHLKNLYGELDNKEIKAELIAVSKEWSPFDETKADNSYIKYRMKPAELYADAISVLFNDPLRLKEAAPKFYKGWFDYLDRKPTVAENFFAIQELLNTSEEEIFNRRNEDIQKSYDKAEDKWAALHLDISQRKTNLIHALRTLFDDRNYELNLRVKEQMKKGVNIESRVNPALDFEGLNYMDGKIKTFVADNFQPAYEKAATVSNGWDELGKILQMERVINERGEFANPGGYSPKEAQEFLDGLKKTMSETDWNTLSETKDLFRKGMDEVVKIAEENGYYTPEMIEKMKANKNYATFAVIDYLDTYISPAVRQQIGTLKDVANPAITSIMKAISTLKAIEINNAKRNAVDFQKEFYKEEIEPAKTMWNGKFREVIEPKDANKGKVIVIRDGKIEGYYIPKDLADVFNRTSPKVIRDAAAVSRFLSQSKIYKPLFTSINLGFQTFNFVRDFKRYWKNVPDYTLREAITSLPRAVWRYGQAVPHAFRDVIGRKDQLITDMENLEIIGLTYNDFFYNPDQTDQKQIERIMYKAGVLEQPKKRKLLTPFYTALEGLELFGNFIERLPKVAGYIELKDKLPEKELAHFIRNYLGSPNFRTQGTATPVTNNIWMFSNAIKEGIKSDLLIASGKYRGSNRKQSKSGFWWKTVISEFMPTIIMALMAAGVFGEELKKRMDNVSEYDKTNYIILPFGFQNNKTQYLRIPKDETGRLLSGILWKVLNVARKGEAGFEDFQQIFAFNAGQLPNLSPNFTALGAIEQYLSGQNPYDTFRSRNIIPDTEFQAGTKYSFPVFMKWLLQNQGLGIILPNYTPDGELSNLEKLVNLPVLSNILGRWVKSSNYGQTEQNRLITSGVKEEQAQETLRKRELLDKAVESYLKNKSVTNKVHLQNQLIKDTLGNPAGNPNYKRERTELIKKFNIALQRQKVDPDVNSLLSAQSNDEKVLLLLKIKQVRGEKEVNSIINTLRQQGLFSDALYKAYLQAKK